MLSQACHRTQTPIEVSHHPISAELSASQVKKLCGVANSAVQVLVNQAKLSWSSSHSGTATQQARIVSSTSAQGLPAKRKAAEEASDDQHSDGMRVSKCEFELEALSSGCGDVPRGPLVYGWARLAEDLPRGLLGEGSVRECNSSSSSSEQPRKQFVELRTKNYQAVVRPVKKTSCE